MGGGLRGRLGGWGRLRDGLRVEVGEREGEGGGRIGGRELQVISVGEQIVQCVAPGEVDVERLVG